jgi:L-fuconolactonase
LAGDYAKVWAETNRALGGRSERELDQLLGGTAIQAYNIQLR